MKTIYFKISILLFSLILMASCGNDDYSIGDTSTPSGMSFVVTPSTDGSGVVQFTYSAENAFAHRIIFSNLTDPSFSSVQIDSYDNPGSGQASLSGNGVTNYKATYYAYNNGAVVDSIVQLFEMNVVRPIDAAVLQKLTNGSSKTWTWDKDNPGHLGVGPSEGTWPEWYQSAANEKPDCLYNDVLTFTKVAEGVASFSIDNVGDTFIHVDHTQNLVGESASEDTCYPFNIATPVNLAVVDGVSPYAEGESTGVFISTGDSFLSYALESNVYEIVSISDSELYVRTIEYAPDGFPRAWYQRFVSSDGAGCESGDTGNSAGTGSYVLVWEDNFDVDGAPCGNNWQYDIGAGGWGNGEQQYYTDRPENVVIENGMLKITAIKETYNGAPYTSARLKSQDLLEFTYGKVEVRAKLPTSGGSWPAIWMLGANFPDVGWPACGEIDIMEHVGNNANTIINAIHTPSSFGNTVNVMQSTVSSVTDFHVYAMEWDDTSIKFYTDDVLTYTYQPTVQDPNTWPFDNDMFLIMNIAVGGTLGGNIDPNFPNSVMEVDYVKVYQK